MLNVSFFPLIVGALEQFVGDFASMAVGCGIAVVTITMLAALATSIRKHSRRGRA